jgi:hypothetical protein
MRTGLAFTLIVLGIVFLMTSLSEGMWRPEAATWFSAQDWDQMQSWLPSAVVAVSVTGFLSIAIGVVVLWRGGGPAEKWRPWLTSLDRLAAEHGQPLVVDRRDGLSFIAYRDGQRVHIRCNPESGFGLVVRGMVPGRQSLCFIRPDVTLPGAMSEEYQVGAGRGWQLRAELPAIARILMNDVVLVSLMDRFFSHSEALGIVHDAQGVEVFCSLPAAEQVERRARTALDIVSYLRRVNG